jgi:integrase/recombinase XerD
MSFLSRQARLESGESIVVVVDEGYDPHAEACAYLKWLQYGAGRSPGTARTYGSRVAAYLTWAERSGIDWRRPTLDQLSDLVRWLHRGDRGADITPRTAGYVNLGLTAAGGFLRFCALHGSVTAEVADRLSEPRFLRYLPQGFDPGESGNRIVRRSMLRMKTKAKAPKFLTAGQQDAVIGAAGQVRDRFMAELLFGTGVKATPHTCRHTFATRLVRAGVDRDIVQELLGHASPASTAARAGLPAPAAQGRPRRGRSASAGTGSGRAPRPAPIPS